jgi:hypothetical protein
LPTSAPSSKAKTKTKCQALIPYEKPLWIGENKGPGLLPSEIARISEVINVTEAPGNPHLANAIADKTSQISKERKLRPSDILIPYEKPLWIGENKGPGLLPSEIARISEVIKVLVLRKPISVNVQNLIYMGQIA